MNLPSLLWWGGSSLRVALVGAHARGFSYALMEKRRLLTGLVYAL